MEKTVMTGLERRGEQVCMVTAIARLEAFERKLPQGDF